MFAPFCDVLLIISICVHVPMSLRARASAPGGWPWIKVLEKVWIWMFQMLTRCLGEWATSCCGWVWFLLIHSRVIHCFLIPASTALCYAVWACFLVSWRLLIDWWDLPQQPPSVSVLQTVFAALRVSYSVSGGRSLRTLVVDYNVLTIGCCSWNAPIVFDVLVRTSH